MPVKYWTPDMSWSDAWTWAVMRELVRGRSLAEELAQRLPPLPQAPAWAERIALVLESAPGPEAGWSTGTSSPAT
ncbi:hypothetical protein OTB20_36520 [Streptomyces sp. H27-H1]|uniref:hypothetical protein n=1 Tax=Streptomyces sp. H27-H1 TaxID=2996461 RepID=UPI00226EC5F8|nr:hypothetical protein [Streptomyces sp. H27-H1]MCY0931598.1 hypothetical protein [Streptomyces sp. H27-H1]